jgi:hypothetical protein
MPCRSPASGFFFSEALRLLECNLILGHFRRTGRIAHLLLTLVGFRADLAFAEVTAVKSSQVNTLPKAKSKTRSKQNKDMHKCSSVYSGGYP